MKRYPVLFVLVLLILSVSACSSGAGATNFTPERATATTQNPTATPRPSPTLKPTEASTVEPTEATTATATTGIKNNVTEAPPELVQPTEEVISEPSVETDSPSLQLEAYTHPTGAFNLAAPQGWQIADELPTEVVFTSDDSTTLGARFIETSLSNKAELYDFIDEFLMDFMADFAIYYEVWTRETQPDGSIYVGLVYNTVDDRGDAEFFFKSQGPAIFILYLITSDYDQLGPTWPKIIDSFSVDALAIPIATPTTPPLPATATTIPPPAGPTVPEGKGLIIFNNHTGTDFIVEFVGPGNLTHTLPPTSSYDFILEPGHYTLDSHSPGGDHFTPTFEFDIAAGQSLTLNLSGAGMGTTGISQN